jgi:hypothetical protein
LVCNLTPFRNRDAALALAVFLARHWSAPDRIEAPFSVDRRKLADRPGLDLTEACVRGAIRTLEAVGYLDRIEEPGSQYHPTEDGLHRKPITYRLGLDYRAGFEAANKRAAAARGRRIGERRPIAPNMARRPSPALPAASPAISPKSRISEAERVYLGEIAPRVPQPVEPYSPLEAALARLEQSFRLGRSG